MVEHCLLSRKMLFTQWSLHQSRGSGWSSGHPNVYDVYWPWGLSSMFKAREEESSGGNERGKLSHRLICANWYAQNSRSSYPGRDAELWCNHMVLTKHIRKWLCIYGAGSTECKQANTGIKTSFLPRSVLSTLHVLANLHSPSSVHENLLTVERTFTRTVLEDCPCSYPSVSRGFREIITRNSGKVLL